MNQRRIAVVAEDEESVRELIELVLVQSGFEIVIAEDGPSAVEAIRRHSPLLTTLDVQMPGMDGFEVAKRVREFSETYLVMITSLSSEAHVVRGLEAGADDYLVKPFRPKELRARADAMLRRSAFAQPAARTPESWVTEAAREFKQSVEYELASTPAARSLTVPAGGRPPAAPEQRSAPRTNLATTRHRVPSRPAPEASERGPFVDGDQITYGDLVFDISTGRATVGGRGLTLSQPEAQILVSLLRTGRRVRSKADLVLAVRGHEYVTSHFVNEADKRAVDGYVESLRRKVGDDSQGTKFIETVRDVGFRLAA